MAIFPNNQEKNNFETAARNVERSAVEQVAWSRIGEIEMGPFAYYQAMVASGVIKRIEEKQYRLSVNQVAVEAKQAPVYPGPAPDVMVVADEYSNIDNVNAARQQLARINSDTNERIGQPPVDTHNFSLGA